MLPVRVAVVRLPRGAPGVLSRTREAADLRVEPVGAGDAELPAGVDAVLLVGEVMGEGEACAGAPRPPIMGAIAGFAAAGGPVLGVGDGLRALCAAGLLPGLLDLPPGPRNVAPHDLVLRVEGQPTPFTQAIAAGRLLRLRGVHAPGRFRHGDPLALERAGQIVLRYVDDEGGVTAAADPSGSVGNIAGICDERGTVVGVAPYPGDASMVLCGAIDGVRPLESLALYLEDRLPDWRHPQPGEPHRADPGRLRPLRAAKLDR